MRTALLAVALVLPLVLGGCLGDGEPAGDADGTPVGGRPADDGAPARQALYLTGDMGLTERVPQQEQPEQVPVGSFYAAWARGEEQPTWEGEPLERAHRFTSVDLVFFYTAERAVATTGPQEHGFPEFVVYVGTEAAPMAWASVEGPDVVRSGELVQVEASLELPKGGLVLPTGARPVVKIAPVQAQGEDGARIVVLVNGTEAASRAVLEGQPWTLDGWTGERVLEETGVLAGSAYATGPSEGTTAQSFQVEVAPEAAGLRASLNRTQGAGIADIDLELLDPGGEVVARSVTPEDDEGIALYQPNVEAIGGGTWTLRAVNYGNVAVEFELQATLLGPR